MRQVEMMEMKTEMDQILEKLEEACRQLNQAKAKEAEMTNQLQDQAQKVWALFICSHDFSHTHRMSCCRESVTQWRQH